MADDQSRDLSNRSPAAPDKHTAWVIWLHGRGESGSAWLHLVHAVGDALPWIKWSFPDGPERRMTCSGGTLEKSWFDVAALPIPLGQEVGIDGELRTTTDALQEPDGLPAAVSAVHAMLKQAESMGFASDRLCLGGFGEGAALALLAARLYPRTLGGVIGLGGWHLRQAYRPAESPNHATPIMLLHGTHDETVPIACLQESVELLLSCGYTNVKYHSVIGEGHGDCADGRQQVCGFLKQHLSQRAEALAKAGPETMMNAPARSKSVVKMGGRRGEAGAGAAAAAAGIARDRATPVVEGGEELGPTPLVGEARPLPPPKFTMGEVDGALKVVVAVGHGVGGLEGLDLRLDDAGMELEFLDGSAGSLCIVWPSRVNADAAKAKFSRKSGELRVVVPRAE